MSAVNATTPQQDPTPEARSSEPSMEDILASIRRIIADDQTKGIGLGGTVARRSGPVMPPYAPSPELPADRPPPSEPEPAEAAQPVPEPAEDPNAFAVEAEAELDAAPEPAAQPHLNPPSASDVADYVHDPAVIEEIANAGVASILRPRASAPEPEIEPAPTAVSESMQADQEPEDHYAAPTQEDEADWTSVEPDPEPLLSAEAGASVGSSFQALATTVFMQNTDMIEQMMRDMLRPMLRNWLDDNLPTIVERLVRAEIERVARGGRG